MELYLLIKWLFRVGWSNTVFQPAAFCNCSLDNNTDYLQQQVIVCVFFLQIAFSQHSNFMDLVQFFVTFFRYLFFLGN